MAVDKWKNARLEHRTASTEYIAAVALPDAAAAMFLTTLTTAVAFFATAICPVAPIKMFAIFCGLLIIFDYLMNVLLVFPALCIYDKALIARGGHRNVNCCISLTCCGLIVPKGYDEDDNSSNGAEIDSADSYDDEEESKPSLIRRILIIFYDVLHTARWPLFGMSLIALGLTIYFASTLALPTSSDVRILNEDVQYEQNYIWQQRLLSNALEKAGGSQAYFMWGVKAADTGDQSKFLSLFGLS